MAFVHRATEIGGSTSLGLAAFKTFVAAKPDTPSQQPLPLPPPLRTSQPRARCSQQLQKALKDEPRSPESSLYSSDWVSESQELTPSTAEAGSAGSSVSFERLELHASRASREKLEVYHKKQGWEKPEVRLDREAVESQVPGACPAPAGEEVTAVLQEPMEQKISCKQQTGGCGSAKCGTEASAELNLSSFCPVRDIPWLDEDDELPPVRAFKRGPRFELSREVQDSKVQAVAANASVPEVTGEELPETRSPGLAVPPLQLQRCEQRKTSKPRLLGVAGVRSARERVLRRGSPVTFFLEGRVQQYFGRLRCIEANGTYTVDLVGGARMAGLDAVSPCGEMELAAAQRSNERPGMPLSSRTPRRSTSAPALPPAIRLPAGTPVSFASRDTTLYGRIRSVHQNGTCTVNIIGGGIRAGVAHVTQCAEADLEKALLSKKGMVWHKDPWSSFRTRNATPSPSAASLPTAARRPVLRRAASEQGKRSERQQHPAVLRGIAVAKMFPALKPVPRR